MVENPGSLLKVVQLRHYIEKDGDLVVGETNKAAKEQAAFSNGNSQVLFGDKIIWLDHSTVDGRAAVRALNPSDQGDLKSYFRGIGILPDHEYII